MTISHKIINHSPEFGILLSACRAALGMAVTEEAGRIIRDSPVDWNRLYRRADMHSVRPQLAQLTARITPGLVPDKFITLIDKTYQDNLLDQISYVAEFMEVRKLLETEGIMIVPFKGFWLAHKYYGELGGREGGDIDVFTEFLSLERIRELMTGSGYIVEKSMSGYDMDDLACRAGEYNFGKWDGQRCLFHFEFHFGISSPVYGMGINLHDLGPHVIRGDIQEQDLMRFTPSADLLLTVMHHGGKDAFTELKYVHDIAAIMKKQDEIDWEWVLGQAYRFRLERLIYVALRLAYELFDTPVPAAMDAGVRAGVIGRLAANRIRFMTCSLEYWHPRITFNDWVFRIRTRRGMRIKIQLGLYITGVAAKRFLFPGKLRKREAA